jgi:N-acetylglucosamine-6-phosphate deacetylase
MSMVNKSDLHSCIDKARIPGYEGLQRIGIDTAGRILWICAVSDLPARQGVPIIDVSGDWVSLGGVDLQINGALGLAFPDLVKGKEDQLEAIAKFLWDQGIDAFLPTLVTTSVVKIQGALACLATFQPKGKQPTAQMLGAHLEGPFLNRHKRGAHPEGYLQPLRLKAVKQLLADYAPWVKVMTLAPELDLSGEALIYLRSQNIIVSLGHSMASAVEAQTAFALGATMVTHAFNAMPPLHHREPGLLGAAVMAPGVYCGLIADGQHVSPLMLQWLLRASNPGELFLVSDALAPLGLPDGLYPWDSRQIEVTQGTARLSDGTLSGTTLPLLEGVKNLVKWGICSAETAIALATEVPRRALGLAGIGPQQNARQLLRWHRNREARTLTWERMWPDGPSQPINEVPLSKDEVSHGAFLS